VYEALLRAGIIVRPLTPYGMPRHLRITIGTPEQMQRLLAALPNALAA
jgi:histidinol-phosphate aminotransferase